MLISATENGSCKVSQKQIKLIENNGAVNIEAQKVKRQQYNAQNILPK